MRLLAFAFKIVLDGALVINVSGSDQAINSQTGKTFSGGPSRQRAWAIDIQYNHEWSC